VADATHAGVADSANSVAGGNVTGTVANATYATSAGSATTAGTVTTAAQPNITSVGTLTSLSVSGNVQGGNIRTAGVVSTTGGIISNGEIYSASQLTGGNINGANIVANGYLCATGNIITTANISGGNISATGSINLAGRISAVGNITGGNILTGANVSATSNITGGNLISNGVITTVGNVVANYFVGNGAALFAIAGANVTGTVANATYAVSAGSATTAGTVTTNAQPNITSVGTLTTVVSTGNISTTGNITGNYLFGNGSQLTGLAATYGDANVSAYLAGGTDAANIITTANISGNYILGNGSQLTGLPATYGNANVVANLAALGSNPVSTTGNVTAGYLLGNGSALTSITGANVTGSVGNATYALSANSASSLVNGASAVLLNSDGTMVFPSNAINTSANPITLWSNDSSQLLWRNAAGGAPGQPVQTTITAGNGTATITVSTGVLAVQTQRTWTFNTAGNVVFPDTTVQTTAYPGNATSLSVSGNVTGGNINTGGLVTATGNVTGGNLITTGAVSSTGSMNLVRTTGQQGEFTFTDGVGSGFVVSVGTGLGTWAGAGSLNLITSSSPGANIGIFVAQTERGRFTTTGLNVSGVMSASGNVTGGNLNAVGLSLSGNVVSAINTTANITTTANISGGNIIGTHVGNVTGTTASLNGNVTGGNILTGGLISATGNATAGNISTAGLISATGNITGGNILGGANVNATTHTGTTVSMSGNVTGGNVIATTTVYANAITAFVAGSAANSGVALQMPQEGALRNLNNGLTNMYFDVSTGGSTNGQFQFRSSNAFTNVLTMSPTAFNVSTDAVVTARTPSFGRLAWNSAIDTELTVDNYRFRVSNQGGIFPQVISNTGGTVNSAWTVVAARSGSAITQTGSTGTLVPNNAWTSLYTSGGMDSAGDTYVATLQDKSAGRIYRVTFMRSDNGATTGYNIIAERLL
jgi:hypothetical protein